ncbi:MAG: tyrosine-type recombinase/integrase [Candidatus Nanopelagicales bacterium]
MSLLARLSWWMHQCGAGVDDISEELLDRFTSVERSRLRVCGSVSSAMFAMRRFLTETGYLLVLEGDPAPVTPSQVVVGQWCSWLREQRGLAETTIAAHRAHAAGLLDEVTAADGSVRWDRLDATVVNGYVTARGRGYAAVSRANVVTSVRCLLQWALATGRLDRDLRAGILKPSRARGNVPRGVSAAQVSALLAACDPVTVIGVRDRALIIVLVRLGLRAGEAAALSLDDIDWANACVRVTGKGREHVLPIPVDVGQALTDWLRVRPVALDRAVFVRTRAPRRRMATSGISGIVARVSSVAGIDAIYAHRLRHTAAMGVLAEGGSLIEARELLGHARTATTMAYAKADLASLRELVVPFGQVPS